MNDASNAIEPRTSDRRPAERELHQGRSRYYWAVAAGIVPVLGLTNCYSVTELNRALDLNTEQDGREIGSGEQTGGTGGRVVRDRQTGGTGRTDGVVRAGWMGWHGMELRDSTGRKGGVARNGRNW